MIHAVLVYALATFLFRWRCKNCGKTFLHYPPGILPRQQYLPGPLLALCRQYVREEQATYRQVVKPQGQPIRYDGIAAEGDWPEERKRREETRALSHTTLWRWLGGLGKEWKVWRKHAERLQRKADRVEFRPWHIAPHKYRSEERHQILIRAAQVLEIFSASGFSTDFETMGSGP